MYGIFITIGFELPDNTEYTVITEVYYNSISSCQVIYNCISIVLMKISILMGTFLIGGKRRDILDGKRKIHVGGN